LYKMRINIYYLIFLLLMSHIAMASSLKPFTSDGCSSFPDGTFTQQSLWGHCCMQHDLAYWKGGSELQKQKADEELERCVAKVGEPKIAKLMLAGVQVGGSPKFRTPFRWGYGWPYGRGYKKLSHSERLEVKQQLETFKSMIDDFINRLSIQSKNVK